MTTKTYTIGKQKQLIDLNEDTLNFIINFELKSNNNIPFYMIVTDQKTLDSGEKLEYKHVSNGTIKGNITQNDNIYQNYYIVIKSDKPCDVKCLIKKQILPNSKSKQEEQMEQQHQQQMEQQHQQQMEQQRQQYMEQQQRQQYMEQQQRQQYMEQQQMEQQQMEQQHQQQMEQQQQYMEQQQRQQMEQQKRQNMERYIEQQKLEQEEQNKNIKKDLEIKDKKKNWKKIILLIGVICGIIFLYYIFNKKEKKGNFISTNLIDNTENNSTNLTNNTPKIEMSLLEKLNSVNMR
jgi:hypothetical protein